ncbi:hypothetical protein CY34DRAFT_19853 [Suillus luteus UH-Slu-Lm8-n1]|uniref:Uncharacterized protein n=1 Tax=Suillus luteus UH-Slu-Lm8-n1 TaxID=930992 RepID=A0A0C9ZQG4_9AGAM|nr:hypothetical protein CY34DRAFT_19853 [Suillus luteus UH-Slu-Lm8-n1]
MSSTSGFMWAHAKKMVVGSAAGVAGVPSVSDPILTTTPSPALLKSMPNQWKPTRTSTPPLF